MQRLIHVATIWIVIGAQIVLLATPNIMAMSSDIDVDVELPIPEIQNLIQQLQDAGNQLIGEAAIQMRQTIAELSDQIRQRIDQIHEAANDVIRMALTQLRAILNDLVRQARALLAEVNRMVQNAIQCITAAAASIISSAKDAIFSILEKVSAAIRDAVNQIYQKTGMLLDKGSSNIKVIMDSTLVSIAKVAIIVLLFIMLFWLVRALWRRDLPKVPALRYGVPIGLLVLVGIGVFLLVSPSTLGSILGSRIELPKPEKYCEAGDQLYNRFMEMKSSGADSLALKAVGDSAMEALSTCSYATMSTEIASVSRGKAEDISAVLYPPPLPPTTGTIASTCPGAGGPSIDPGWLSLHDKLKVARLGTLVLKQRLSIRAVPVIVRDTTSYYRILRANPAIHFVRPIG